MHNCTSRCNNDIDCPLCEHGKEFCPSCDLSDRERSIAEMDIIKNWYNKRWISYGEYLRLTDLAF